MGLEIMGKIGLDGRSFASGLEAARSKTHSFGKEMSKEIGNSAAELKGHLLAAFSLGGIAEYSKKVVEFGSHLTDLSSELGVGREPLQEFIFSAQLSGAGEGEVSAFFEKLASTRKEAIQGNEDLRASFKNLGISLEDLKTKRLEDLGRMIGKGLDAADPQKALADIRNVGGRSAGKMIPGLSSLEEASQMLKDVGGILNEEVLDNLDRVGDKFTVLSAQIRGPFAQALSFVVDRFTDLWDLLNTGPLAAFSKFAGAVAGGAGLKEAFASAKDTASEVLKAREARKDAEAKMEEARKKARSQTNFDEPDKQALAVAQKQMELQEKLIELTRKNNLEDMDAQSRINALRKERTAILQKSGDLDVSDKLKAEQLRGEINKLVRSQTVKPPLLDSLQRIGGFNQGTEATRAIDIAQKQLLSLELIREDTSKMAQGNDLGI